MLLKTAGISVFSRTKHTAYLTTTYSAQYHKSLAPNRDQHERFPRLEGAHFCRCHRGSRLCLAQQHPPGVWKCLESQRDMQSLSAELLFHASQTYLASSAATHQPDAGALHPQAWPICMLRLSEVSFGCRARPATPVPLPVTSLHSKAKVFLFPSQTCDFLRLLALPCAGNAGPCYRQAQASPQTSSQLPASAAGLGTLRHVCTAGLLCLPYIPPDGCLDRKGTDSEAACFETGNIIHALSLS